MGCGDCWSEKTRLMDQIVNLVREIKKCEEAEATMAAVIMCFVCIDTMAFLAMPAERNRNTRADFVHWVNRYLKADSSQSYQYRGQDVYAARCAVLHSFSAEGDAHRKDRSIIKFGYTDGGQHAFNPDIDDSLAIIGTASFINDVVFAVEEFLRDAQQDTELRVRIGSRLDKVFAVSALS